MRDTKVTFELKRRLKSAEMLLQFNIIIIEKGAKTLALRYEKCASNWGINETKEISLVCTRYWHNNQEAREVLMQQSQKRECLGYRGSNQLEKKLRMCNILM